MKYIYSFLLVVLSGYVADAETGPKTEYLKLDSSVLSIRKVTDSLQIPWEILWGPDGYIWFTERVGYISRMDPSTGIVIRLATIEDCYSRITSGLLGMALHPDFDKAPYVYVVYTVSPSDPSQIKLKIRRYRYDKQLQKLVDPRDLIKPLWLGAEGAYGCRLVITPRGELFATIGDAGDGDLAQDTTKLQGKIWRLDLDGKPYPGNPFHNEVYSYGHRNPQGLVLAPTGILYSSEHGPEHDDEINIIKKGLNYGWPEVGGKTDTKDEYAFARVHKVEDAIYCWTPTIAPCGLDYYDKEAIPEFKKSLILATLKMNDIRILSLDSTGTVITRERKILSYKYGRIRDICISPDGRIFFCSSNDKHHPDQVKAAFDAIYEMKFDHKESPPCPPSIYSRVRDKMHRYNMIGRAIISLSVTMLFIMMALFAYRKQEG